MNEGGNAMRKSKKLAFLLAGMVAFGTLHAEEVKAFKPAAHYALIQNVSDDLSTDSMIRKAIKAYTEMAAWGSIGPDLGSIQVTGLAGYTPWADRYHYYKVGSFA